MFSCLPLFMVCFYTQIKYSNAIIHEFLFACDLQFLESATFPSIRPASDQQVTSHECLMQMSLSCTLVLGLAFPDYCILLKTTLVSHYTIMQEMGKNVWQFLLISAHGRIQCNLVSKYDLWSSKYRVYLSVHQGAGGMLIK